MPPYSGVSQVMEVTSLTTQKVESSNQGWEAEYAAYLAEKHAARTTADISSSSTPLETDKKDDEPWEAQHAAYCEEKEARLEQEDAQKIQEMKKAQQECA